MTAGDQASLATLLAPGVEVERPSLYAALALGFESEILHFYLSLNI